ncbi:MFS transporter [Kitasatospora sp. NBC_00240]|uniref:MFS transporter n=1 Tax=Kitasatospora sp. NBC_00240 TaxID=2903567 RepID=UPI00224E86A4|nr:MFS transporter [Kitasatospora sp. NBC_00240]MCX5209400.1 MFS transporter [Kitasatospora sp. NBC_00240]
MPRSGFLSALNHRQYRLLFGGQLLSSFGDWIDFVALISLVAYQWQAGAGGLAVVSAAAAVPWMLVAPFAGVWADRLPQKQVMIGCDLARAALVLGYLLAPNLPVLVVLVVAKVAVSTLFVPAQQSTVTLVVPKSALLAANSLSGFVTQVCKIAGPALGGVLLAVTSPQGAFVVDAATFLLSALILSRLRLPARSRGRAEPAAGDTYQDTAAEPAGRTGFRHELREGITFVLGNRVLLIAIGSLSATIFLVLAFDTLSPLVLVQLGISKSLYGPAIAAVAAGAVAGTVLVGQWGQRWNAFTLLATSQAATGVLIALIGAAVLTGFRMAPPLWLPVAVGIGLCSTGILVVFLYLVQRATPQELMGRVSTVVNIVPTVLQISAPLVGAALAVWIGLGWVLAGAGTGLAVLGAVFLRLRPADVDGPADDPGDDPGAADGTGPVPADDAGEAPGPAGTPDPPGTPEPAGAPEAAGTPERPALAGSADDARPGRPVGPGRQYGSRKKVDMANESVEALAANGHSFEGASEEQLAVIANLSPEEVEVINSIKSRLDGEVAAHSVAPPSDTVGGLVW